MPVDKKKYNEITALLGSRVVMVAVSKTKKVEEILEVYEMGQREFGENYVQELVEKEKILPKDIRWHFIGHLQTNKVKQISPFVRLIHAVDSFKLLMEINKQAQKNSRIIDCLMQIHIAREETKFGLDENELNGILHDPQLSNLRNIHVAGLMGMASLTGDKNILRNEFSYLKSLFDRYANLSTENCRFSVLSMGMSNDYQIALEEGATLIRIGSLIFGER